MRKQILVAVLLVCLPACGSDDVTLRGSVAQPAQGEGVSAWVVGGPAAAPLADSTFEITGIGAGPIDLVFAEGGGEIARTELRGVPAGALITLERIGWDRGRAFPTAVRVKGAKTVMVNGIRMADPSALPRRVESIGVVLATSEDADELLIRPHDPKLPDLRVVVTPPTQVVTPAGEPASVRRLSLADPVRVEGHSEEGFVIATRLVLPAEAVAMRDDGDEDRSAPAASRAGGAGESNAIRRTVDRVLRRSGSGEAKESRRERERREEREDRERGQERERGRGNDDIPPGHRPPPGECRDWIPGRPPGQQPPPYKC